MCTNIEHILIFLLYLLHLLTWPSVWLSDFRGDDRKTIGPTDCMETVGWRMYCTGADGGCKNCIPMHTACDTNTGWPLGVKIPHVLADWLIGKATLRPDAQHLSFNIPPSDNTSQCIVSRSCSKICLCSTYKSHMHKNVLSNYASRKRFIQTNKQ